MMAKEHYWEENRYRIGKRILQIAIIGYLAWGFLTLIQKPSILIADKVFCAGLLAIGLWMHKKANFSYIAIILAIVSSFIHNLLLYGNFYFGLPFDRLYHFFVMFAICWVLYEYIYATEKKGKERSHAINVLRMASFAFFIAIALGALFEIIEFIGYANLGEGPGIFMYGQGDFGEYANLAWDLISNALGALTSAVICYFFVRK